MHIELETTPDQFEKLVVQELYRVVNSKLRKIAVNVERNMETVIPDVFRSTPIYSALVNGDLRGHFGFPKGSETARADAVVDKIADNTEVIYTPFTATGGDITIAVRDSIYDELLALPEAVVVTEKGETLNWLEWLLLRGTEIIIADYKVVESNRGRSGLAIMIKSGSWSVPSEYAGTASDNWLTQTFADSRSIIHSLFEKLLQSEIDGAF